MRTIRRPGIDTRGAITQLLQQWRNGEGQALDELTPMIYAELHRLASHHMRMEDRGHLLQTTALVHEAFLRLVGADVDYQDRDHFFSLASRLMRRVLVDLARRRKTDKRGGGVSALELDEQQVAIEPNEAILELDQALQDFARIDPRKAEVIELRYFGGLQVAEIVSIVGRSIATVERDLRIGKAWLKRHMAEDPS